MRRDQVCGRWVHAHEEDDDDKMVFRPAESELPPSRGRLAFELREDGTFAEAGLGPDDVPEHATGTWSVSGDTIALSEGATQGLPRRLDVVAAEAERLVIRVPRDGEAR